MSPASSVTDPASRADHMCNERPQEGRKRIAKDYKPQFGTKIWARSSEYGPAKVLSSHWVKY